MPDLHVIKGGEFAEQRVKDGFVGRDFGRVVKGDVKGPIRVNRGAFKLETDLAFLPIRGKAHPGFVLYTLEISQRDVHPNRVEGGAVKINACLPLDPEAFIDFVPPEGRGRAEDLVLVMENLKVDREVERLVVNKGGHALE